MSQSKAESTNRNQVDKWQQAVFTVMASKSEVVKINKQPLKQTAAIYSESQLRESKSELGELRKMNEKLTLVANQPTMRTPVCF